MLFLFFILRIANILCHPEYIEQMKMEIQNVTLAFHSGKYVNSFEFFEQLKINAIYFASYFGILKPDLATLIRRNDNSVVKPINTPVEQSNFRCKDCFKLYGFNTFNCIKNLEKLHIQVKEKLYCKQCFVQKIIKGRNELLYEMKNKNGNIVAEGKTPDLSFIIENRKAHELEAKAFNEQSELSKFYKDVFSDKNFLDFLKKLRKYYITEKNKPFVSITGKNVYCFKTLRIDHFLQMYENLPVSAQNYINDLFLHQLDRFDIFNNTDLFKSIQFVSTYQEETVDFILITLYITIKIQEFGVLLKKNGFFAENLIRNPCNYFYFINSVYNKFENEVFDEVVTQNFSNVLHLLSYMDTFISKQIISDDYSYEEKTYLKFENEFIFQIRELVSNFPFEDYWEIFFKQFFCELTKENGYEIPNIVKFRLVLIQFVFNDLISL